MYDDFTSAVNGSIRSLSWQGAYCDPRFQVPLTPPRPVASTFQVAFYSDENGFPSGLRFGAMALHESNYSPAAANERLEFALPSNESVGCGSKVPAAFAYYRYTVALSPPLPVMEGRRYWLRIVADVDTSAIAWAWRVGKQHNNFSVFSILVGATTSTYPTDQAFSLSE